MRCDCEMKCCLYPCKFTTQLTHREFFFRLELITIYDVYEQFMELNVFLFYISLERISIFCSVFRHGWGIDWTNNTISGLLTDAEGGLFYPSPGKQLCSKVYIKFFCFKLMTRDGNSSPVNRRRYRISNTTYDILLTVHVKIF